MATKVQKWGNSLGVRIPALVAQKFGLKNGSTVSVTPFKKGILVTPISKSPTLQALVDGITSENSHEEISWGNPVGKEIW